ncbi:MAG TPA: hypothetical protein VNW15_13220 [Rhizomicrobium sp.]|jgi:hypothetical protein|nr:hypothetical protein [Rhizomicrobium sp.]
MRFSDWQLNRLRDALRAFHKFGLDPVDGRHFNWKDVSEAIFLSAEVEVPPERLRQFVEGVTKPGGSRSYRRMQDDRLEAIVKFVTDEDYGLISEAELREHAPSWHAAQRLLEYLKQEFDTERILPPSTLEGTYRNGRIDEDSFVVRELTLQRASDDGLIQLVQIEDSYDIIDGMKFDYFSPEEREKVRDSRVIYGGWAILTPEDNLLMFLKKERTGHNCYYLTVAAENWHALQAPAAALALLRHDYPIQPNEGEPLEPKKLPGISEAIGNNISLFSRIT